MSDNIIESIALFNPDNLLCYQMISGLLYSSDDLNKCNCPIHFNTRIYICIYYNS